MTEHRKEGLFVLGGFAVMVIIFSMIYYFTYRNDLSSGYLAYSCQSGATKSVYQASLSFYSGGRHHNGQDLWVRTPNGSVWQNKTRWTVYRGGGRVMRNGAMVIYRERLIQSAFDRPEVELYCTRNA